MLTNTVRKEAHLNIIDYHDPRAIYEQIAAYYQQMILRGVLAEDEQMPSVRSLAVDLATNPNTVQKAYTLLESEGYIYSVKGRGSFVREASSLLESKKQCLMEKVHQIKEEADELGLDRREVFKEIME